MDSELKEILSTSAPILQSIKRYESEFDERFSQFQILYDNLLFEIISNKELIQWTNKVKHTQLSNLQDYESVVNKNKPFLEEKKAAVASLEKQKTQKLEQLETLQRQEEMAEGNIASTINVQNDISKKKDQILTYKLLTATNFVYSGKTVVGYVGNKSPKTFTFDPKKTSQEEITEGLWKLIIERDK